MTETEATWTEFYCGTCHTEAAFFGPVPDEFEFVCACDSEGD